MYSNPKAENIDIYSKIPWISPPSLYILNFVSLEISVYLLTYCNFLCRYFNRWIVAPQPRESLSQGIIPGDCPWDSTVHCGTNSFYRTSRYFVHIQISPGRTYRFFGLTPHKDCKLFARRNSVCLFWWNEPWVSNNHSRLWMQLYFSTLCITCTPVHYLPFPFVSKYLACAASELNPG